MTDECNLTKRMCLAALESKSLPASRVSPSPARPRPRGLFVAPLGNVLAQLRQRYLAEIDREREERKKKKVDREIRVSKFHGFIAGVSGRRRAPAVTERLPSAARRDKLSTRVSLLGRRENSRRSGQKRSIHTNVLNFAKTRLLVDRRMGYRSGVSHKCGAARFSELMN